MPIRTDLNTEAWLARFRAQKAVSRKGEARPGATRAAQAQLRARATAPGRAADATDSVEISLAAHMTVEAANGVMLDSVVEQINKAIQEAGIDLTIEEARVSGMDLSPEATARRIVDFSAGFAAAYESAHPRDPARVRISGFMSLIRGAIRDGFQQARDFLEGVTRLSDTVERNIDRSFELTNEFLDAFHASQLERLDTAENAAEAGPPAQSNSSPEVAE